MKLTGIYKIQSISKPERVYVGSAIDIKNRWACHKRDLNRDKHDNGKLQNHFNKYADLVFIVVELCEKEKLIEKEQYYIDTLNPWFNIRKVAENNSGVKYSEESKKRCSDSHMNKPMLEQTRQAIRNTNIGNQYSLGRVAWNKGLTYDDNYRDKLSKAHEGIYPPEETKQSMKRAQQLRRCREKQYQSQQ